MALVVVEDAKGKTSAGSGFVFGESHLLVTAAHVVGAKVSVQSVQFRSHTCGAEVLVRNEDLDLALLALGSSPAGPPLRLRDEVPTAKLGSPGLAMGYPDEPGIEHRNLAFRPVHIADINNSYLRGSAPTCQMIKLSETLEPGFSGGPLIAPHHGVVGVLVGVPQSGQDIQESALPRSGWAVPAEHLSSLIRDLPEGPPDEQP